MCVYVCMCVHVCVYVRGGGEQMIREGRMKGTGLFFCMSH